MKKVLITGAKGMLGRDVVSILSDNFEVIESNRNELDITDMDACIKYINFVRPDIVIHAAAFTNVDECEKNMKQAYKINALGTRNIALACSAIDSVIVYISTDYVFNGRKESPYREYDTPDPINHYGESKLEGEKFLKQFCKKYFIVRTSWLFGSNGKNFIKTILHLCKTKSEIEVVDDQIGAPTFTVDLAKGIERLIQTELYGIYHITNSGCCSWNDLAKLSIELAEIKGVKVNAVSTKDLKREAVRPQNSRLENYYWRNCGFPELRSYKDSVREYINMLMTEVN